MSEPLTITTERVDDIPLLMAQMERMGVASLLDQHFPTHGNWGGLSLGRTSCVWLTYILSQADHRLNQVQEWAAKHLHTLAALIDPAFRALDVSDDRLAAILSQLSDDERWNAFEGEVNAHLVRVYALRAERVRLDSTTASGYWEVTEEGLFQFGHSKDHRPDLPQVKVMLGVLDPLGLPVASDVVSGEHADDPLYLPSIQRIHTSLQQRGLLYVGDCKLGSLLNRATLAAAGDCYLCPLSARVVSAEAVWQAVIQARSEAQPLVRVERPAADGTSVLMAEGYERSQTLTAAVDGKAVTWTERWLVVRSLGAAHAAEQGLRTRLQAAQAGLADLNVRRRGKKRLTDDHATAQQAVAAILSRYKVTDLLQVSYTEATEERVARTYRDRPPDLRAVPIIHVASAVDEAALTAAIDRLGWRVYATNQPSAQLSLEQAVLAYRDQYHVEHGIRRLKGQPLSLTPMYLTRDDHATGLIRLLVIALRVLCLLEFVVRRRLAQTDETLSGLYVGQPKRATTRPTAERLLAAFQEITLTVIDLPGQRLCHLTPLSALQQRILRLLDFSSTIYSRLTEKVVRPP